MEKFMKKYLLVIFTLSFQIYPGLKEDFQKRILGSLNIAVQKGVAICHLECDKGKCTNADYPGVVFSKGEHFLDINSRSTPVQRGDHVLDLTEASEMPAARESTCGRLAHNWNAKYFPIAKMCELAAQACKRKRGYNHQKEDSLKRN